MAKLNGIKVVNENTVEYNGLVYGLVTGDAKVDDIVKASEQELDVTKESFYLVTDIDDDNDIVFKDDVNDSNYFQQGDHLVFRKSRAITNDKLTDAEGVVKIELPDGTKLEGTPSDLASVTRSMQALQAEQVASVEMPEEVVEVEDASEPVVERLQVGDYAKVIDSSGSRKTKLDDIVKVLNDDKSNAPYFVEAIDTSYNCWLMGKRLVKATDEEVLEAKQSLLKEGDFARVIANTSNHSFEIGTVVNLKSHNSNTKSFTAYYLDESDFWGVYSKDLEPLTAEEAEHIACEAEEEKKAKVERAKWEAIGREVGELRDGDVVRVIDEGSSDFEVGEIATIKSARGEIAFLVTAHVNERDANCLSTRRLELIVPVEQRFDTVG
ncbi:hypothetical protein EJ131_25135 [Bacillus mycoides]|uniref:hypothetical protein n=1 Tax=Bacillus mycoides TaxID=1405 RepID=UPI0022B509B1|nr:hypothetical protein [Bacillus mycoides]MCZ6943735.1 hypothetical protein [Bacillus mycoides]